MWTDDLSLPALDSAVFASTDIARLRPAAHSTHAPRILMLYGSVRERSFSRLLTW